MSGVGRGRGAVLPAWMKAKGLDAAPVAPGAAAQEAAPAISPKQNQMPAVGSKRSFDSVNHVPATAAVAATTTLPPGWHESFDPKYQRNYYYNYSTGERTWIKPELQPETATSAAAAAASTPAPAATAAVVNAASLPVSARWEKSIDPASGKTYYYNHATGESVWVLPEGATLLQHTAAVAGAAAPAKKQREEEEEPEEGEVGSSDPNPVITLSQASVVVAAATIPATETAAEEKEKEESLPPGWAQAIDPGSGRTYYYNHTLNITQWHYPSTNQTSDPAVLGGGLKERITKNAAGNAHRGGGGGGGGGGMRRQQPGNRNEPLDPMDPSSYSDTPRGGWGAGLGKETAM